LDAIVPRSLGRADADEAAEVIRAAFAAQSRAGGPPSALRETASSVAANIEAGCGIRASSGGALVALALWRVEGGALHVGRVAALPARRGRGLRRALMAACEAAAKGRGLERMTSRVRLELPKNERLFERFGFERRELAVHEGFDSPTQAVMEKSLA
jgi:GNAT superfamily N-acetyltransferase